MEVNITKRIDTPDGRRFCRVIFTPNGRIKPDWVEVDERQEKHPEGAYYLDWTEDGQRRRMAVGSDATAVVEYTYAIGDRIIVPAGARVYGQLQQADRSGLVRVKFDEIELLDGAREKIDGVGTGLDLGPIKGIVYGKNTGKNFLVRAASGLGSVLAEVAGNNSSAAFSEDDMLREQLAENIGTAGDSEVMGLNANSRVIVSVPADTKIYIVFTKHEQTPSELHRGAPTAQ